MNISWLAVRALNEYRRVSPLTYLGLRYSMMAESPRDSRWAEEIAVAILERQDAPSYLACHQYKQVGEKGKLEFRNLYFPGANEALAETALLAACAMAGGPFDVKDDVFSYHLTPLGSAEGVFRQYFHLFAKRQTAISKACLQWPNDMVLYADIKSFYPSVTPRRARNAWEAASKKGRLDSCWRGLGHHLLDIYQVVERGLLIGPMFSHVVGNLVLTEFDRRLRQRYGGRFFRYVDDIALVIPPDEKQSALEFIRKVLHPLGLRLNPKKIHHLSAVEWRAGAPHQRIDYEGMDDRADDRWWMNLIDKIKCYLMANPETEYDLARAFKSEGIRIALPRYMSAIQDAGYVHRFERRLTSREFKRSVAGLTVSQLVGEARAVGILYRGDFDEAWQKFQKSDRMQRKWLISQIRYLLGRLVVVAPETDLAGLAAVLKSAPDFAEFHAVFDALARRDASDLVRFSGKICAAAGQAMATSGQRVRCVPTTWNKESVEGYANLVLFGVELYPEPPARIARRMPLHFLSGECESRDWFKAKEPFFQEIIALAGHSSMKKHRELMDAPIDPEERWVLFADELRGVGS